MIEHACHLDRMVILENEQNSIMGNEGSDGAHIDPKSVIMYVDFII